LRLFPIFRARFPELVDAAFAAGEGELVGPVPMAEGWVVFLVLEKKRSEAEVFERVRRRAAAMLRQQREIEVMNSLIGRLREERRDEIALYPERVGE
jgi:peptidyl-prolyl cis-trans isomerase D